MRFNLATFICFLFFVVLEAQADCLPDDKVQRLAKPIKAKFAQACNQGIRPGGAADVAWVKKTIFPKYLTKAFIGKALPADFMKDVDSLMAKCFKDADNYCLKADQDAMVKCAQAQIGTFAVKYGQKLPEYCPLLDKIVTEWPSKHEKKALGLFPMFCRSKGKEC
ncbi:hypothetical protein B0H34DRAFT_798872 [Crassisporium funariophilum]|nr:hypothetical protein B0H34DRAFT_798872 [Crassisporium funariophilum]